MHTTCALPIGKFQHLKIRTYQNCYCELWTHDLVAVPSQLKGNAHVNHCILDTSTLTWFATAISTCIRVMPGWEDLSFSFPCHSFSFLVFIFAVPQSNRWYIKIITLNFISYYSYGLKYIFLLNFSITIKNNHVIG